MQSNKNLTVVEAGRKRQEKEFIKAYEYQKDLASQVLALLEDGQPLSEHEARFVAVAVKAFVEHLLSPLPKKTKGRPSKVPNDAIIVRQAKIEGGMSVGKADLYLASFYEVDLETMQSKIKRVKKRLEDNGHFPAAWGFKASRWGRL